MLIWAVVCIAVTGLYVGNNHAEAATTGTLTSDYVYFRKSPNGTPIKYNGSAILLRKGQKMTVLSTSNKTWYKVKLTYKKKSYTGYVYSAFIKVTRTTSKKAHLRKNENYVYFRKTPNGTPLKYNGSPIMLMGGQSMTVLSTSNKTWYKVKLTYKKKRYTGYVYSKFIVIDSTSATTKATTKATTQQPTTAAQAAKSGYVNEDYVYFRQTAAGTPITYNGSAIMLMKGQALSVTDTSNKSWYKVNLTYSSKKYTGFISSSLITMGTYKEPDGNQTSDAAFEKQLSAQNFPESYKVLLRKLHAEHPNWIFKAVHTNLNWNDVVKNEVNVQGRVNNLVNCTSYSPNYGWRSQTVGYNYKTDSYSSYDGSTWFAASDDLVKYYLDPRTYMSSASSMFAFEKLSYDSSQTKSGVEAILSGSFMHNAHPSDHSCLKSYRIYLPIFVCVYDEQ